MEALYRYAYISKKAIEGAQSDIDAEITKILKTASKRNTQLNISGALLYSGGYFCQILEGERDALDQLMAGIAGDPRHTDVCIVSAEPIEERGCKKWAMALAGVEHTLRFRFAGIKPSTDKLTMKASGEFIASTMEQLVLQLERGDQLKKELQWNAVVLVS